MIPKENNIIKKKKNTLDKKVWVDIACGAIAVSNINMIHGLLQGEYPFISFCNIVGYIVKMGGVFLVFYLSYRYLYVRPSGGRSSNLQRNWAAPLILFVIIICLLLAGHYMYPKLWDEVVIGLIVGAVWVLLKGLVFLFEKVLKVNKVS